MHSLLIAALAVLAARQAHLPGRLGWTGRAEGALPAGFPPTFPRIAAGQAAIFAV